MYVVDVTVQDIVDGINDRLRDVVVVSHRYPRSELCFLQHGPLLLFASSDPCVSQPLSRWVAPHNPDVGTPQTGEQLKAIRVVLHEHTRIKHVWFDFPCMPQQLKDTDGSVKALIPVEEVYFRKALSLVNLFHLHATMLFFLDEDYGTGFWCLYEAFLATHEFDAGTSVPEEHDGGSWNWAIITCITPLFARRTYMSQKAKGRVFIEECLCFLLESN